MARGCPRADRAGGLVSAAVDLLRHLLSMSAVALDAFRDQFPARAHWPQTRARRSEGPYVCCVRCVVPGSIIVDCKKEALCVCAIGPCSAHYTHEFDLASKS